MHRRIKKLDESIAGRIAAGEVVERPSSIVKELLENALDAGADRIEIELEEGGTRSIDITDNGEGIDGDDIALAFERHATSKIDDFDDLYRVQSFGFRGEALPSIASISRIDMISRREESLHGTRVIVEGGRISDIREAGSPRGTRIRVTDIFYTTPVRKKFLKKATTEQAHCLEYITRLALSTYACGITVRTKKKTILTIPPAKDMRERTSFVLGKDFADSAHTIGSDRGDYAIRGLISRPDVSKSNTREMLYYINGRYVKDGFLNHAVMTAYRGVLEPRRYPSVVIYLTMPPGDVDINVHPTKMEVRFRHPRELYSLVVDSIMASLADTGPIGGKEPVTPLTRTSGEGIYYGKRITEAIRRYTLSQGGKGVGEAVRRPLQAGGAWVAGDTRPLFETDTVSDEQISFTALHYLGQFTNTYLFFTAQDRVIVIDQHAAHERVLYERLRRRTADGHSERQTLLLPEIIELQPAHFDLLAANMDILADTGLDIEPYGDNTIIVKSVTPLLSHIDLKVLISDLIDEFVQTGHRGDIDHIREKVIAVMACRGAVKARDRLTEEEVASLCRDLDSVPFAATCPHGRPLFVSLGTGDMERMFKRR